MATKIDQVLNGADFSDAQRRALSALFKAAVGDLDALATAHNAFAAKLDADAGTGLDVDYEATIGVTLTNIST